MRLKYKTLAKIEEIKIEKINKITLDFFLISVNIREVITLEKSISSHLLIGDATGFINTVT